MMRVVAMASMTMLLAAGSAPAPLELATTQPLDTLEQCFRAQWAGTGKITAINTAAGVMLDLTFDNVGTDGKVATGHLTFSVEDQGTQRKVTATGPNGADDQLANQLLAQAVKKCLPDASHAAGTPPPSLIDKRG